MSRRHPARMAARALDLVGGAAYKAAGRLRGAAANGRHAAPTEADPKPDLSDATSMYVWCQRHGVRSRPQYLWPVLLGARLARSLSIPRISCLEFGVAGGNGLLALEEAADAATSLTDVDIDVYGFDMGTGMPEPVDHRDIPWVIKPGYFEMDEPALRARLERANLVIGNIATTVPQWMKGEHAPIGFASFDVDYYSSTIHAFGVFEGAADALLPRVPCYFDDVFGYGWSELNGELAAIADYNATQNPRRCIAAIPGLRYTLPRSEFMLPWHEQMYLLHVLDHPRYNDWEGPVAQGWFDAHRLQPLG